MRLPGREKRGIPPGDLRLRGVLSGREAYVGPRIAHIDLTNRCANRCLYCWNYSPLMGDDVPPEAWSRRALEPERVEALLEELAELKTEMVIYSGGGDPIFYPHLDRVIGKTRECGMASYLVTALIPARWERIEAWAAAGLTFLVVSLWAASGETYRKTHPGSPPDHFARLIEIFRRMREERQKRPFPRLILIHAVSSLTCFEVGRMVEIAGEVGAEAVWFNTLDAASERMRPLLLSAEQVEKTRSEFERIYEAYRRPTSGGRASVDLSSARFMVEKLSSSGVLDGRYHADVIDAVPCTVGWLDVRVLADGTVCPCCKGDRFPLGNIREKSFREIWFSERYNRFREKALRLSKRDPYFRLIDCPKICDNWSLINEMNENLQTARSRPKKSSFFRRLINLRTE